MELHSSGLLAVGSDPNQIVRNRTNDTAMNLYLRLLWTLIRAARLPKLAASDVLERTLRVWPGDLDIIGHMNNARYLAVVDLMLVEFFVRTGIARAMLQSSWRPMSGGSVVTYRKQLRPFQQYRLRFTLQAADTHWNYMRFEFLREDGVVCAAGIMKGAVVGRSGLVTNSESYARSGHAFVLGELPETVEHWLAAERGIMAWSA
jgi:acyl-CoA thioesterase FadM